MTCFCAALRACAWTRPASLVVLRKDPASLVVLSQPLQVPERQGEFGRRKHCCPVSRLSSNILLRMGLRSKFAVSILMLLNAKYAAIRIKEREVSMTPP